METARQRAEAIVRGVLIEALALEGDEIVPQARLSHDLNAESIDYLDISFRLEKMIGHKVSRSFEDIMRGAEIEMYDNQLIFTQEGMATVKKEMAHFYDTLNQEQQRKFDENRSPRYFREQFTVEGLIRYVHKELEKPSLARL